MVNVVRVRESGTDEYGDPIEGTPTRLTIRGCIRAPRTTSEIEDRGRQGVIVGETLYAPPRADILATDQIEIDGVLFNIEGQPGVWQNPFTGWKPGLEVALTRGEG